MPPDPSTAYESQLWGVYDFFQKSAPLRLSIAGSATKSRACYYHIRDMRRLRRFLTPSVAKTIATSLIGSKLHYSNSVLFNVTEKEISKLQGVQNCLARIVTKSPRFCHLLKSLHWLPVYYRGKFKLCSLTYQALTSEHTVYIQNMLQPL